MSKGEEARPGGQDEGTAFQAEGTAVQRHGDLKEHTVCGNYTQFRTAGAEHSRNDGRGAWINKKGQITQVLLDQTVTFVPKATGSRRRPVSVQAEALLASA